MCPNLGSAKILRMNCDEYLTTRLIERRSVQQYNNMKYHNLQNSKLSVVSARLIGAYVANLCRLPLNSPLKRTASK